MKQLLSSKVDADFLMQGFSPLMSLDAKQLVLNDFNLLRVNPFANDFIGLLKSEPDKNITSIT